MSKSDNTKWVDFRPGFDKRSDDPKKDYGIGGVRITFFYGNQKDGFVQFVILTDWYPEPLKQEMKFKRKDLVHVFPMAADVGYHSPVPRYEDQMKMDCDLMEHGHCYYDGSGLLAEKVMQILSSEGSEAVWKFMEKYWEETFE